MTLSTEQLIALRTQIRNMTDEQLVLFVESNGHLFDDPECADIIRQAEAAYDRVEKAKSEAEAHAKAQDALREATSQVSPTKSTKKAKKAPREFTEEETRRNAAWELRKRDMNDVADALQVNLDEANGQTLEYVAQTLHRFVLEAGFTGFIYVICRTIGLRAREYANAAADFSAEKLFDSFVNSIRYAIEVAGRVRMVPRNLREKQLAPGQAALDRARSTRWQTWSYKALERLMTDDYSSVCQLIASDKELRDAVYEKPQSERAREMIRVLLSRGEAAIDAVEIGPMREGKTARAKEKARASKADRSAKDAAYRDQMKGSSQESPLVGKGKKSPRKDGDPNRRGK